MHFPLSLSHSIYALPSKYICRQLSRGSSTLIRDHGEMLPPLLQRRYFFHCIWQATRGAHTPPDRSRMDNVRGTRDKLQLCHRRWAIELFLWNADK